MKDKGSDDSEREESTKMMGWIERWTSDFGCDTTHTELKTPPIYSWNIIPISPNQAIGIWTNPMLRKNKNKWIENF